MKRIIGGTLVALAIASGSMVLPAVAGATTAPHSADDVQPFLWGTFTYVETFRDCVDVGEWGYGEGRWRGYDCAYHPERREYPWEVRVDFI